MAGGQQVGANLARSDQKLVELQMVIAQAAWNRSAAREVLVDKGANDIVLEARFLVNYVIRNAELLRHITGVVDVVDRAATSLHCLWHAVMTGEATLVPK